MLTHVWKGRAPLDAPNDHRTPRHAPVPPPLGVWKSYVLQEAEATGRSAKLEWAAREGARVLSLQHDGVILGRMGRDEDAARRAARGARFAADGRVRIDSWPVLAFGAKWIISGRQRVRCGRPACITNA